MLTIEQLPLELWLRILSHLDAHFQWEGMFSSPVQSVADTPIKIVSLASRSLQMRTLSALFTYVNVKQHFSERKILKNQDLAFSKFVNFLLANGLQGKKAHVTFQVKVHEEKRGERPLCLDASNQMV